MARSKHPRQAQNNVAVRHGARACLHDGSERPRPWSTLKLQATNPQRITALGECIHRCVQRESGHALLKAGVDAALHGYPRGAKRSGIAQAGSRRSGGQTRISEPGRRRLRWKPRGRDSRSEA